jgi:AraC-like DNA-binding protein
MGSYRNRTEVGDAWLKRPSAILYRANAQHENLVGELGFEQLEIEFDPDWLGDFPLPDVPASRWTGGWIASLSRTLALDCARRPDERTLRSALTGFLREAVLDPEPSEPAWLKEVEMDLRTSLPMNIQRLATRVGRHPFWLGQAYRRATGESLNQARSRVRVERASKLLRETNQDAASIAYDAGFCDQSHMIRTFGRVLGRKPSDVRADVIRELMLS